MHQKTDIYPCCFLQFVIYLVGHFVYKNCTMQDNAICYHSIIMLKLSGKICNMT